LSLGHSQSFSETEAAHLKAFGELSLGWQRCSRFEIAAEDQLFEGYDDLLDGVPPLNRRNFH